MQISASVVELFAVPNTVARRFKHLWHLTPPDSFQLKLSIRAATRYTAWILYNVFHDTKITCWATDYFSFLCEKFFSSLSYNFTGQVILFFYYYYLFITDSFKRLWCSSHNLFVILKHSEVYQNQPRENNEKTLFFHFLFRWKYHTGTFFFLMWITWKKKTGLQFPHPFFCDRQYLTI